MMNLPKKELEKFSKEDKVVSKYMYKLNRINEDPAFLNLIDYEHDNIMVENTLKKRAWKRGLEEGKKEGIKEGIKEGKREAIVNLAKNMLDAGMNIEDISKYMGISAQELEKIL